MEVSLSHISEVYLYEYYINHDEYDISKTDQARPHLDKAKSLYDDHRYDPALQEYLAASMENPVSMEAYAGIISCCRHLGDVKGLYTYTIQSYKFCSTRAEMAAYYRNLGWYYLETYKPKLAADLYRYSTFFQMSDQAEEEIRYLERALNRSLGNGTPEEISNRLKDQEIPTTASSITLALLVKAAEEASASGNDTQALDCYKMVYDLTEDAEIYNRIMKLMK